MDHNGALIFLVIRIDLELALPNGQVTATTAASQAISGQSVSEEMTGEPGLQFMLMVQSLSRLSIESLDARPLKPRMGRTIEVCRAEQRTGFCAKSGEKVMSSELCVK